MEQVGVAQKAQFSYFEEIETDLLKQALERSYKERFLMATTLYKVQKTMQRAVITHKPSIEK